MAKFSKDLDIHARNAFLAQDEARRQAGRSFDGNRYVRCRRCNFTVRESDAEGIERCPQCQSEEPGEVLNLPYDPAFNRTTPITVRQARVSETRNQVPRRIG